MVSVGWNADTNQDIGPEHSTKHILQLPKMPQNRAETPDRDTKTSFQRTRQIANCLSILNLRYAIPKLHHLRCELDAIFAHMKGLARSDIEWIPDAQAPSSFFPPLKQNEMRIFGEYRTQRYVLQAFGSLERGQIPNLRS